MPTAPPVHFCTYGSTVTLCGLSLRVTATTVHRASTTCPDCTARFITLAPAEWTPTTELVRRGYSEDPVAEYHDPITNHTRSNERAFDRWLATHDAEVAAKAVEESAAYLAPFSQAWHTITGRAAELRKAAGL